MNAKEDNVFQLLRHVRIIMNVLNLKFVWNLNVITSVEQQNVQEEVYASMDNVTQMQNVVIPHFNALLMKNVWMDSVKTNVMELSVLWEANVLKAFASNNLAIKLDALQVNIVKMENV